MRINYAIVFVSDMKKSVAFYRDVLGMPLKFESPGWTEFATDGATLALHLSNGPNPNKGKADIDHAGHCRTGFTVPNLDEFHKKMLANNVPCIEEPKSVFGTRIAQYSDPDGMGFSVGEDRCG